MRALSLPDEDRRWLVPGVTDQTKTPAYWIELNDWLVTGGLELIHGWAYQYIEKHGYFKSGEHAPSSEMKKKVIEENRGEAVRLVHELIEAAKETAEETKRPVYLLDQHVINWLRREQRMRNDTPDDRVIFDGRRAVHKLMTAGGIELLFEKRVREGTQRKRYQLLIARPPKMDPSLEPSDFDTVEVTYPYQLLDRDNDGWKHSARKPLEPEDEPM